MANRPEYPKDVVRQAFQAGGADAARKEADEIAKAGALPGAARAPSQVERWIRDWGATGVAPSPEKPASEPRRAPERTQRAATRRASMPTTDKRRVYDVGEPNVHGTVIGGGEQVSTVRWDVPKPWGKECHVSNEQLRDVESEPSKKDRHGFLNAVDFSVVKPNGQVKKGPKGKQYREDMTVSSHKTFKAAIAAADDESLWVFARTKGGTVTLLMRPHWEQYSRLEE